MSAIPESVLGEWIRHFRVQQRQIHNGRPWAQEDLAVAIGSNKSHINRIERGRQTPSGVTLQRICDALNLPWRDRTLLLNLAGYLPRQLSPTVDDVTRARSDSRVLLREAGHPMRLDDDEQRLRDLNELLAYVLFGRGRREAVLATVEGRHTVELLFSHPVGDWWQRLIVNYDEFVHWSVAGLFERCLRRDGRPELPPSLASLAANPAFRGIWDDMAAAYALDRWTRPSNGVRNRPGPPGHRPGPGPDSGHLAGSGRALLAHPLHPGRPTDPRSLRRALPRPRPPPSG